MPAALGERGLRLFPQRAHGRAVGLAAERGPAARRVLAGLFGVGLHEAHQGEGTVARGGVLAVRVRGELAGEEAARVEVVRVGVHFIEEVAEVFGGARLAHH